MALFIILAVLGGLWNTFFAVQALRRGYDMMYGHRFDRQREPFSFWFYSILGRGGSGLLLLSFPLIISEW